MRARRRRSSGVALVLCAGLLVGGCGAVDAVSGLADNAVGDTGAPSPTDGEEAADPPATPTQSATATSTPSPAPDVEPAEAAPPPAVEPEPAPSTSTPTPEPEPEPEPDEDPTPTAEPEPDPEPEDLAMGASGARVTAVQQRLVDLGYWGTAVDGSFGAGTRQAVWALQKAAGLSRDGVVGPRTQQALDDGVRPGARSSSGHVIEIDLNRQLVLLVDDGVVGRVLNASSGNGETYDAGGRTYRATTSGGSFAVGRQVDALHESSLELGDMWRPKFFNGAIALHGADSVPAWPASHGCVRVSNGAMNYVWDTWQAPPGTPVLVY
ncbi:L,D-transpeptidase family protein [Paraoerskovia marina]|uniref:L,D-transpeptidase family protein n=1 Tax=Paraoerskovia marina TaxID=545619 RepID=UPI0006945638|nr:L,D-transpeptidase family protein [Paraoerskovia marina]